MSAHADEPALVAYLDRLVEALRGHVPEALERGEGEAVHQARVGTRRLKAALDLMKPVLSRRRRRPFARALQRLRRRLGPLRDLDVMLGHLETIRRDERHTAAADWVIGALRPQREAARRELPSIARTLDRLDAWRAVHQEMVEAREAIDTRLAESLHAQIDAFAGRAAALGRPGQEAHDPHALRIAGKALRYTLEMAAEAGHPLPDAIRKAFKRMQTSLGLWHDHVVLTERCLQAMLDAQLPHHDAAMAAGVLALARLTLREADRQLARFRKQWSAAGDGIAGCIRERFPLSVRSEAPPEGASRSDTMDLAPHLIALESRLADGHGA